MKKIFILLIVSLFSLPGTITFAEQLENCLANNGCIQDSYFISKIINIRKSGNQFIIIQMEFENLTDKKERISFSHARLVDSNGNESVVSTNMPAINVPEKGKRSIGLSFEFKEVKQLSDKFHLTIEASSPPGSISFIDLKAIQ